MESSKTGVILSHPTGNRNSRASLNALYNAGVLKEFCTTLASPFPMGQLLKRYYPIPFHKISQHPWRELLRQSTSKFDHWNIHQHETGYCSIDQIYQSIDRKVSKRIRATSASAVYAYEDAACDTFKTAKEVGIHTVYELPIAYWETSQKLLSEEADRYPEWKSTLTGTFDSQFKLERKTEELSLADLVICPSLFVKRSISTELQANKRIQVIPYGIDETETIAEITLNRSGKLRLLYVGILTQRKGLADLFEAIKLLPKSVRSHLELHVIGKCVAPIEFYKRQGVDIQYHGTRPRSYILEQMQQADLLVLPSIIEGRALVQLEALSQGLPLLISNNTGGDDLIVEGETGFQVPIRSPHLLAEKIEWFLENKDFVPHMKQQALIHCKSITWSRFEQMLLNTFKENSMI